MNRLIEDLIAKGMGNFMDVSRDTLAMEDEIYKADREAENELEKRYESLDLTREQRIIVNDYIACTSTVNHRYADISYMCGIKNTVELLSSLGLIKGMEEGEEISKTKIPEETPEQAEARWQKLCARIRAESGEDAIQMK